MEGDCSDERFVEYLKEARIVAEKIIDDIEQQD